MRSPTPETIRERIDQAADRLSAYAKPERADRFLESIRKICTAYVSFPDAAAVEGEIEAFERATRRCRPEFQERLAELSNEAREYIDSLYPTMSLPICPGYDQASRFALWKRTREMITRGGEYRQERDQGRWKYDTIVSRGRGRPAKPEVMMLVSRIAIAYHDASGKWPTGGSEENPSPLQSIMKEVFAIVDEPHHNAQKRVRDYVSWLKADRK